MSVYISTNTPGSGTDACNIHSLPCKIEYDGKADVSKYFQTSVRNTGDENMTCSLRGRPLDGQKLKLPPGYSGFVIKENRKPFMEDEDRNITVSHKFSEITYWNLDRETSSNDEIQRAMEWLDITKAVHGPVDEESSQKSVPGN